jgi:hypothetical protein
VLSIGSNLVENAIRPSTLGKKEPVVHWASWRQRTQDDDLQPARQLSATRL